MHVHLVARARAGASPFAEPEQAAWMWSQLRKAFPNAIAAMLMPNHPHLVVPAAPDARVRLVTALGTFSRRFGSRGMWEPVPEPEALSSSDKLRRTVRYAALNPCRPWRYHGKKLRLVADPLEWPWSTYRDVVGGVTDPWVDAARLARAFGDEVEGFRERFHRYVSSDPAVRVEGTPLPRPAPPADLPSHPLRDVEHAVLAATRAPPGAHKSRGSARALFVGLAYRQGWRFPTRLGAQCGITREAAGRLAARCPQRYLDAGALCLGDARLRVTDVG